MGIDDSNSALHVQEDLGASPAPGDDILVSSPERGTHGDRTFDSTLPLSRGIRCV